MSVLQLRDILLFGVPLVLSASTLASMHWYPWNRGARPLDYLPRYTMGTLVVVGYPIVAMLVAHGLALPKPEPWWVALLITNTLVSGATVKLAYWIDGNQAIGLEEGNTNGNHL